MLDLGVDRGQAVVGHLQGRVDLGAAAWLHLGNCRLDDAQVGRRGRRNHPARLVFEGDDADLVVFAEELGGGDGGFLGQVHLAGAAGPPPIEPDVSMTRIRAVLAETDLPRRSMRTGSISSSGVRA